MITLENIFDSSRFDVVSGSWIKFLYCFLYGKIYFRRKYMYALQNHYKSYNHSLLSTICIIVVKPKDVFDLNLKIGYFF